MHQHVHSHPHPEGPARSRRRFSFAQQGAGVRLLVAGLLVALIWAALLPLVLAA